METKVPPNYLRKIGATILDYGLYTTLLYIYVMYFGEMDSNGTDTVTGLLAIFPILFWFFYFPIAESIYGSTIGHYIFDLEIIKINGKDLTVQDAFKRRLVDPIDLFMYGIPAFILISKTNLSQRIGDIWAGTIVVQKDEIEHILKHLNNENNP